MLLAFQITLDALLLCVMTLLDLLMPMLTRRDLLFGVTVPANARATPEGRAIIRGYRVGVLGLALLAALALALAGAFASESWWESGWSSLGVIVFALLLAGPYLWAYRASRKLRASASEAGALPTQAPAAELHPRRYSDDVPLVWEALPLAVIGATALYLGISYNAAPAVIPVHFNATGAPDSYATKTIGGYFLLIWMQLALAVFLTGITLMVVHAKALPGRAESRFRRLWIRYLFGLKTLLLAFLGALAAIIAHAEQTGSAPSISAFLPLTLGFVVVAVGSALALAFRTGQGGARLGAANQTATDRMNDRYWKLGAFYVNPQAPSFLVEKRFGVGWTLNFGNPKALAAMIGLLAVIILLPMLIAVVSTGR
jgi:uncharacterized membrane protein